MNRLIFDAICIIAILLLPLFVLELIGMDDVIMQMKGEKE